MRSKIIVLAIGCWLTVSCGQDEEPTPGVTEPTARQETVPQDPIPDPKDGNN